MVVSKLESAVWFIYLLFINHTAWSPRAMAGIERKTTITSSKADTRKQTVKLNKGNPPLSRRPPLSVCSRSHKFHSVVVVAPSQGPLRWCPSRYPSSFSWPYAWALPLEFTRLAEDVFSDVGRPFENVGWPLVRDVRRGVNATLKIEIHHSNVQSLTPRIVLKDLGINVTAFVGHLKPCFHLTFV